MLTVKQVDKRGEGNRIILQNFGYEWTIHFYSENLSVYKM
jgi:hypothetical protein